MGLSDLFSFGWRSANAEKRIRSVNRAHPKRLETIALETRHEDVFLAAVSRLSAANDRYAVLYRLTHLPQASQPSREILARRQQALVDGIDDPVLLEAIAVRFEPEIALRAVARLDSDRLAGALSRLESEAVQQAALERITDQRGLVQVAWNGATPAIRRAAIRKLTSVPVLTEAIFAGNHVKDTYSLHRRLEERLEECAQQQDWGAIQLVISTSWNLAEKARWVLRLPAAAVEPEDLRVIAKGDSTRTHNYELLEPILRRLSQSGWQIREEVDERACPSCGATGHVDDGYGCRDCASLGRIKTVSVSGSWESKSFALIALDGRP